MTDHALEKHVAGICMNTLLTCIDNRLHGSEGIEPFLKTFYKTEYLKFDPVPPPGACYDFARGQSDVRRMVRMEDIGLSIDVHAPERIIIVQHMQCAKYHGTMTFRCESEERRILLADADFTADYLRRMFPNVSVDIFLAHVDATKTVGLESISVGLTSFQRAPAKPADASADTPAS